MNRPQKILPFFQTLNKFAIVCLTHKLRQFSYHSLYILDQSDSVISLAIRNNKNLPNSKTFLSQ